MRACEDALGCGLRIFLRRSRVTCAGDIGTIVLLTTSWAEDGGAKGVRLRPLTVEAPRDTFTAPFCSYYAPTVHRAGGATPLQRPSRQGSRAAIGCAFQIQEYNLLWSSVPFVNHLGQLFITVSIQLIFVTVLKKSPICFLVNLFLPIWFRTLNCSFSKSHKLNRGTKLRANQVLSLSY